MDSAYEKTMSTRKYKPFRMEHLSKDLVVKAKMELGETEEIREESIPVLRKMVLKETRLKCNTSDEYLLQFLRVRKFSVKKAFARLQNFYHVKKTYPDVYGVIDVTLLDEIYRTGAVSCLPYRCDDGCSIVILNIDLWDPDRYHFTEILLALTFALIFAGSLPATQISGIRLFLDAKNTNLKHCQQALWYTRLLARGLTNALPIRYTAIHIVNESVAFQYFWGVLKIFLTEKLRKRVHVHGENWEHLQKFIPKEVLPTEYGGENDIHASTIWFPEEMKRFHDSINEIANSGYQD